MSDIGTNTTLRNGENRVAGRRVAVIEIGSGSIRGLVADVSEEDGVKPVLTDSYNVALIDGIGDGSGAAGAAQQAVEAVERFQRRAASVGAEVSRCFGTEAMRLVSHQATDELSPLLQLTDVLTAKEEARYSFAAALLGLPRFRRLFPCAVLVDQGRGSLEVVTGATVDPLQINAHQSLDLGTTRLMKTFADCGSDVDKFTSWVRGELDLQALPVPGDKCGGIVQGSVVTKAKWLPLRNRTDERYDPAKVQGLPMTTEALTRVATLARQLPRSQWNRLRGWLGPHSHSDELERLISGSLAIEEVLRRLDIRTFAVSGYGTRYGVAFELGIGALTQQRPNIPE